MDQSGNFLECDDNDMATMLKTLELGQVWFKSNPEIIHSPLLHSLSHVLRSLNTQKQLGLKAKSSQN